MSAAAAAAAASPVLVWADNGTEICGSKTPSVRQVVLAREVFAVLSAQISESLVLSLLAPWVGLKHDLDVFILAFVFEFIVSVFKCAFWYCCCYYYYYLFKWQERKW